LDIM